MGRGGGRRKRGYILEKKGRVKKGRGTVREIRGFCTR